MLIEIIMRIEIKHWILGIVIALCAPLFAAPRIEHSVTLNPYWNVTDAIDSVIIVFKDNAAKSAAATFSGLEKIEILFPQSPAGKIRSSEQSRSKSLINLENMHVAKVAKNADVWKVLEELNTSPQVEYAEPNLQMELFAAPNDTLYNNEWFLHNTAQKFIAVVNGAQTTTSGISDCDIDWQEAWNTGGLTNPMVVAPVTVAIIDTGVDYTHFELTNQMWKNAGEIPNNHIDDDSNGYIDDVAGYDFGDGDNDPMDIIGHGTHCAGLVGAQANNGAGISGVNPAAKIMALKFINSSGVLASSKAIEAIIYAANNGAKVMNNSWGGGFLYALQDAVNYANECGCAVICAAGNSNSSGLIFPAACEGAFSVAAINYRNRKASFSSYGTWLDISAPGEQILSLRAKNTDLYAASGEPGLYIVSNDYYLANGTSMASPIVAGAAALLAGKFPGCAAWIYGKILQKSADNLDAYNPLYIGQLGAGRVNIDRALKYTNAVASLQAFAPFGIMNASKVNTPGQTTNIFLSVAAWIADVTNVWISVSNLTSGISVNTNAIFLGDMPARAATNLPPDTLLATIDTNTQTRTEQIRVRLYSGATMMDEITLKFYVDNGAASRINVADLDGDGEKEIIAVYGMSLYVYDARGLQKWAYGASIDYTVFLRPAIGDVDGDGFSEIVACFNGIGDGYARLFVFEHDGTIKNGWPITGTEFESPALADLDRDGILDIVAPYRMISMSNMTCRAYKSDATLLWELHAAVPNDVYDVAAPAVGDIDGDGWDEVAVKFHRYGLYRPFISKIYLLNGDGSYFAPPIVYSNFYCDYPLSLGDIDGDRDLEIAAIGVYQFAANQWSNNVFAFHHTGVNASGWPKSATNTWVGYDYTPRFADIDFDVTPEVFFGNYLDAVYGWRGDGSALANFPVKIAKEHNQPFIANLDDDASPEFITVSGTNLVAFNLDGSMLPGYNPLVLPGVNNQRYDVFIGGLGIDSNQYLVAVSSYYNSQGKMWIINTGALSNDAPQFWPSLAHDARNTQCCDLRTNFPFTIGFGANHAFGVNPLNVQFYSAVKNSASTNLFYFWDFNNDGTVDSTSPAPDFTYSSVGSFSVLLTVSNVIGESYSFAKTNFITVIPPITADFSANIFTADAPIGIQFTATATNQPQFWRWDFGDGDSSDAQNPAHTYTYTGVFTVTLVVSNNFGYGNGSSATVSKPHYIIIPNAVDSTVHYVQKGGLSWPPYKTWDEAATNIYDAIAAANFCETVFVTNDVYVCPTALNITNITLRSVGGRAIIQGTGSDRCVSMYGINALLEGFTIRGGSITYDSGGGVLMTMGTVRDCVIENNSAPQWYGGGIYGDYGAVVERCVIVSNFAARGGGGVCYNWHGNNALKNSVIMHNTINADRLGSGVYISLGLIENCLIAENSGGRSALYILGGSVAQNCTVANNALGISGGALECCYDILPIYVNNCVSYFNSGGNWTNSGSGTIKYRNSCAAPQITAIYDGGGNVNGDPMFFDMTNHDYHLLPLSAALDAGNNSSVSATNDLDNLPRIARSTVDMGCYEYQQDSALAAPLVISPIALWSGDSGSFTVNPDEPLVIKGMKQPGLFTALQQNWSTWQTNEVLQTASGSGWSNVFIGTPYSAITPKNWTSI
jgi:subtilisin family serine protease/PKD repeat protein